MKKINLESNKYINKENRWILAEDRMFQDDKMIFVHLQVYDLDTLEEVHNDLLDDDVWMFEWEVFDDEVYEIQIED